MTLRPTYRWALLALLLVAAACTGDSANAEASTEADPNNLSVDPDDIMITFSRSTTVGTCFRAINGVEPALPVPCFEQHNAEMFYVGDIPGDAESPDPGIDEETETATENREPIPSAGTQRRFGP